MQLPDYAHESFMSVAVRGDLMRFRAMAGSERQAYISALVAERRHDVTERGLLALHLWLARQE